MPRDEDTARNWLYIRLTGAGIDPERVSVELDAYRAEVLHEAADAIADDSRRQGLGWEGAQDLLLQMAGDGL